MRTWASDNGIIPSATLIDRDAGEGPDIRCCSRRFVSADALVLMSADEMSAENYNKIALRLGKNEDEFYACDGCRETIRREQIVARVDMPLSRELKFPNVK